MDYKAARKWGDTALIAAVALSLSLYLFEETGIGFWMMAALVFVLVIAGLFIKIRYYRCPRCGELLPMRTFMEPKFCPSCGDALNAAVRENVRDRSR